MRWQAFAAKAVLNLATTSGPIERLPPMPGYAGCAIGSGRARFHLQRGSRGARSIAASPNCKPVMGRPSGSGAPAQGGLFSEFRLDLCAEARQAANLVLFCCAGESPYGRNAQRLVQGVNALRTKAWHRGKGCKCGRRAGFYFLQRRKVARPGDLIDFAGKILADARQTGRSSPASIIPAAHRGKSSIVCAALR